MRLDNVSTIPAAFKEVDHLAGISEYRLESNGLRVLVMPHHAAPVATFMVTYHVGSRNESYGLTGATHFLEHLMFKGTDRFHSRNGTSIFNVLQRVGARINATTWLDRTNYYELLPREHLVLAMEIEADRMRNALIDEADVESERSVILNEMDRGENDPNRMLMEEVWASAFRAHPYHHPTIGWRWDVSRVTAEELRHFYDTYYWPNNATVTIVGDVRTDTALEMVARYFEDIPRSPHLISQDVTAEPPQRGERRVRLEQSGTLGSVIAAFKAPSALDADADVLALMCTILSTGKDSRLYRSLTDVGLVSGVTSYTSRFRDPGLLHVVAYLAPGHRHEEVEAVIDTQLEKIVDEGVEQAEVDRAVRQMTAREAFRRDGTYAIASQLNESIAAGDWRHFAGYLDRITSISADDVRRVAESYLDPRRRTVGWYVPV